MRNFTLPIFMCLLVVSTLTAQQRITVMTYNILNYPNPSNSNPNGNDAARASHFRKICDVLQPDVILLQEIKSNTSNNGPKRLVDSLNNSAVLQTLGKHFSRANHFQNYPAGASDAIGNMLLYNDNLFSVGNSFDLPLGTIVYQGSFRRNPRGASVYPLTILPSVCSGNPTTIYFISTHLKAQDNQDDEEIRLAGINDVMNYVNNTIPSPTTANVVFAGDMNFYNTNELGYRLLNNGVAPGFSTTYSQTFIDKLGFWSRNSSTYKNIYTQSTRNANNDFGNGGIPGGLDDRFDFIFINEQINANAQNVSYVNNSYQTFGPSTIGVNQAANNSSNALVNTEIYRLSDHYPTVLDLDVACVSNCSIDNLSISDAVCNGTNYEFEVNFNSTNGSGLYQVRRSSDDAVLGTNSQSPIQVELEDNASSVPFDVYVVDFNDNDCSSSSITVTPEACVDCTIENVNVINALCNGENFEFEVSFTPISGSGLYQVKRASDNAVLGTRSISPIQVELEENTSTTPFDIYVVDFNDSNCFSSNVTVMPENCLSPACASVLTVNDDPISGGTYEASDSLFSAGRVSNGTSVTFTAANVIQLGTNFIAENGSNFTARIAGCMNLIEIENRSDELNPRPIMVNIYPNPTDDFLNIEIQMENASPVELELYNTLGHRVRSTVIDDFQTQSIHLFEWNTDNLPNGTYWIKGNGKVVGKVVVMHN